MNSDTYLGPSGEFTVEDVAKPGEVATFKANEIFNTNKGSTIKWGSPTGGKSTTLTVI
jgi:hypothetical protein